VGCCWAGIGGGTRDWLGGLKREKGRGGRGLVFLFFQTFSNIKLLQVFSRFSKYFLKTFRTSHSEQ
jgi:hypothetical protein